uniref:Putative plant transposon protein domain-containing protein n=1 Tax=Solanum tuberosum TaxID=4113 RepID=M1DD22_SOLTU
MMHGPEYSAPSSVGLFEGKHHEVTSDTTMEIQSSRKMVLRWIAKQIAIDGENAVWVTTMLTLIPKSSLSFPAKVWWAIVRAQLRPTRNSNTLSPSLASLVACLMAGYPVNVGRIIATKMINRALNEKSRFPFPCLIGKLCRQVDIPPNKLIDRWCDAFRLIYVSKIKDVMNHLFGAKYAALSTLVIAPRVQLDIPQADRGPEQGESSQPSTEAPPPPASAPQAPGTFVTIPILFLEKLVADQRQTRTLVDQIVLQMPQLIETKVLSAKKEIKDEVQIDQLVLKDRLDGLENLVQDRFQAAGSVDIEEFKSQLVEMRTQIAKLAEKLVQGELPTSKSSKRKLKAREIDEEAPTDPAREARSVKAKKSWKRVETQVKTTDDFTGRGPHYGPW